MMNINNALIVFKHNGKDIILMGLATDREDALNIVVEDMAETYDAEYVAVPYYHEDSVKNIFNDNRYIITNNDISQYLDRL